MIHMLSANEEISSHETNNIYNIKAPLLSSLMPVLQ